MASKLPKFEVSPLSPEDGGGYLVTFPDYPGCMADGETIEEALAEAEDALATYTTGMAEMGYPVKDPDAHSFSGKWTQRVPRSLHAAINRRAEQEGVSLNTFVTSVLAGSVGYQEKS